ncbi:MAG: TraR/DksA family transcriptional regulator [Chloroflexota bacterium]
MPKKKYADLQQRLLTERDRLRHDLEAAREAAPTGVSASDEPSYGNHLADEATTTYQQEANLALERHMQGELAATEAALLRIEEGTYGSCENCGADIGKERLAAMPTATLCIQCKSRLAVHRR